MNICWSKKNKKYYLLDNKIKCNICNNYIFVNAIINTTFNELTKEIEQRPYCLNCFEKVKRNLDGSVILVLLKEHPQDSIPVINDTLIVKQKQNSQAIGGEILSDKQINKEDFSKLDISRARVSFNENRNKDLDFEKILLEFEKRKKELGTYFRDENDFDDYLNKITESKPVIENNKKKQLGVDSSTIKESLKS